jgi:Bacterial Ig-like domain (group 2)
MSSTWLDPSEAESIDGYGGEAAEDYLEEMDGDGEAFAEGDEDAESRYSRRRRRARRLALARRRPPAALARARYGRMLGPPATAAVVRKTEAEVANLEVESKVQADTLGSALAAQRRQIRAGTTVAAASAVLPSLLSLLQTTSPDIGNNRYIKAGLPLAPLLLLRPTERGLSDRRLWAAAAVAGLVITEDFKSKSQEIQRISITRSVSVLPLGATVTFRADALDRNGRAVLDQAITFTSSNDSIVFADPDNPGRVEAQGDGVATITAQLTNAQGTVLEDFVIVTVPEVVP